ncbi:hypothetical protein [Methylophaga thiooxydans]|uniref:hypothetical protein n=1 Tax=Methylophaga thiooxydans TaxID=392484 RepID=UPI0023538B0D|nr:hypothetical protein [Methylophaga thiooxydans]
MSQNDLTTSININAGGNFGRQMRVNEDRWKRFSKTGQRQMGVLRRSVSSFGNGLDKLGNRYTALLTGAAGAGTAKFLVSLERRFTRLGIQANIGAEAIDELKKKIYETAQSPDIRVDPSQITSAIESIVEKTGDLDFAEANIRNIGLAIQATGAEGTSIGEVLGEFQKMGIVLEKDVLTALDTLNVQGKEGAFTLQNIAALGPRVVTAYTSMGRQGIPAIREMGAALQVIRQGTGSSEMAATAFEALMRTLSDSKKIDMLKSGGIKIFDAEALSRGEEVLRPINEIMVDIIKKTQGKKTLLSTVFDAEAMRAFNSSTAEFQRTGGLESLDKFMNVHADGTTTLEDSTRAANDAAGAMRNLYTAWQQFADSNLTTYIQSLADTINDIDKETLDMLIKGAAGLVAVGGTAILARKLYKGGKGISDFVKGSKAKAAMGGALGGMDGVTPVYVVNMGGKGMGGMLGGKGKKGFKPAAKLGRFESARAMSKLSNIGKLGLATTGVAGLSVAGAGAGGYGAGKVIYDNALEGTEFADALGRSIAKALALFGNDNAQAALSAEKRSQLQIEVTDKRVQVKNIQSDDMDINVDTGPTVGNL